jgi:hypothetical protein
LRCPGFPDRKINLDDLIRRLRTAESAKASILCG